MKTVSLWGQTTLLRTLNSEPHISGTGCNAGEDGSGRLGRPTLQFALHRRGGTSNLFFPRTPVGPCRRARLGARVRICAGAPRALSGAGASVCLKGLQQPGAGSSGGRCCLPPCGRCRACGGPCWGCCGCPAGGGLRRCPRRVPASFLLCPRTSYLPAHRRAIPAPCWYLLPIYTKQPLRMFPSGGGSATRTEDAPAQVGRRGHSAIQGGGA